MKQSINEEINFIWILFCISGWDISSDPCNGVNLFLFNIFNVPLLKTENHLAFSENIPDWMSLSLLFPDNLVNISRYLAIPTFSNNAPLFVRPLWSPMTGSRRASWERPRRWSQGHARSARQWRCCPAGTSACWRRFPCVSRQIVLDSWASGIWWELGGSGGTGSCAKWEG